MISSEKVVIMPRDTTELIELDSLPKFDGTANVNEFLRVFQTKVRLQTTNDSKKLRLLKLCCIGPVSNQITIAESTQQIDTLEKTLKFLKERYNVVRPTYENIFDIVCLTPHRGECLVDFISRLTSHFIDNVDEGLDKFNNEFNQYYMIALCIKHYSLKDKGILPKSNDIKTLDELMILYRNNIAPVTPNIPPNDVFYTPMSNFPKSVSFAIDDSVNYESLKDNYPRHSNRGRRGFQRKHSSNQYHPYNDSARKRRTENPWDYYKNNDGVPSVNRELFPRDSMSRYNRHNGPFQRVNNQRNPP